MMRFLRAIAPENPGNAYFAAEIEAARRAVRPAVPQSVDSTTGQPGPVLPGHASHQPFDVVGVGAHTLINGAQGTRIEVHMLLLYNAGAGLDTVNLLDGGAALLGPLVSMAGGMGLFLPWSDEPYFSLQPGNPFVLSSTAGNEWTGFVKYRMN